MQSHIATQTLKPRYRTAGRTNIDDQAEPIFRADDYLENNLLAACEAMPVQRLDTPELTSSSADSRADDFPKNKREDNVCPPLVRNRYLPSVLVRRDRRRDVHRGRRRDARRVHRNDRHHAAIRHVRGARHRD